MTHSAPDILDYLIEHCVDGIYAANPHNPPKGHPMRWVAEVLAAWCNERGIDPPPLDYSTLVFEEIDGSCGDT